MRFTLAYIIINFLPGFLIYIITHKNYNWSDIFGFSIIYSICFTPIALYIFRIFNIDYSLLVSIVFCFSVFIILIAKRKKLIIGNCDYQITQIAIVLSFILLCILIVVNHGFLTGSVYSSNIVDLTKHYGTLISATSSHGLTIDNPFATTYRMFYYFFFYYKSAEVLRLSGLTEVFQTPVLIFMLDSVLIFYSIIFLFFKIGMLFKTSKFYTLFLSVILLVDGGFDSLYLLFKYYNEIVGGYIDGWVRVMYENASISVVSHSNFLLKLIWQPQHVSAIVPFLLFLYLIFEIINNKKECDYKTTILLALCTVSILGYSALITIPTFVIISVIIVVLFVRKTIKLQQLVPFLIAFLLSIPILCTYIGHDGSSSKMFIRTFLQYCEMIKDHPFVTLSRFFVEYGVISIIFIGSIIYLVVKKNFYHQHCIVLIAIIINIVLSLTLEMGGTNDIGMAMSFVLYILLFAFSATVDMSWILRKTTCIVAILALLLPCILTNAMAIISHNTMNVSLKNKETNIMLLSDYMRHNTNYDDSVVILSSAVRDLNNYVPMLMHTKTFHPFFQGTQYLRGKELDEVNLFIKDFNTYSIDALVKKFESYSVDYFIVLPDSQESGYFKDKTPIYSNPEFVVYKADY